MKLTSFNCTIEVSKDENGCSDNYYIDVTDKGVSVSHPYVTQSQEQVMFVTKLIHDFIAESIAFNDRVTAFNKDMEALAAAKSSPSSEVSPEQTLEELATLGEVCSPEGSNSASSSEDLMEKINVEELEARETGSDMA